MFFKHKFHEISIDQYLGQEIEDLIGGLNIRVRIQMLPEEKTHFNDIGPDSPS